FSLEQVGMLLTRVLEVQAWRRDNRALRHVVEEPALLESPSPAMRREWATARQAPAPDVTFRLTRGSGPGRQSLAAAFRHWSPRHDGPFVTVACTTLAEHLLESELFGHVKGAFTGAWKDKPGRLEAADGGTIFLDEVGELPLELQAKLLRFIEEHRFERVGSGATIAVDARIIAATNRDLEAQVRAGRFREDLFFRLNVMGIQLPALRERREDMPALTEHVLATVCARHRHRTVRLAAAAQAAITAYHWPGNVRELVNALERAVVLARGDTIHAEDLPDRLLAPPRLRLGAPPDTGQSLEELERQHIEQV